MVTVRARVRVVPRRRGRGGPEAGTEREREGERASWSYVVPSVSEKC